MLIEFRIILLQPSEATIPEQKVRLSVSRDEILSAALHFKGKAARDYILEGINKGFPIIELTILNKTLGEYLDAMFTGGRWTDNMNHDNPARLAVILKEDK